MSTTQPKQSAKQAGGSEIRDDAQANTTPETPRAAPGPRAASPT